MQSWYLVKTKPSHEYTAASELENQGFEVFFPKFKKRIRVSRRWDTVIRPLFPGYLFLRTTEQAQSLRPVHSTRGVSYVVTFCGKPGFVCESLISDLKACSEKDGTFRFNEVLRPGETVKFVQGSFEHWMGRVLSLKGSERVIVLLDAINGVYKIESRRSDLVRV